MLADDSVTAQNMGRKILADAGYEVITVNNGSAALKKIAETKPDLIVLDVYMPGYSGLEVCQRLKEVSETARIPVLLTVGKLEPFKPEEAKRVKAEGFIVKPFEASELLSVLAKLEDKIVPRADSSKPGRFARAIAAVEEGRYDKTVPIEEDSGWKSRISFPTRKKGKAVEPEDGDDPAIYNAINKDLKTVIEHKPAHASHPAQHEPAPNHSVVHQPLASPDGHVDMGALVAHGLPADVTPEEIAALAAAAAKVQGITEIKNAESAAAVVPQEIGKEAIQKPEEVGSRQTETAAPVGEARAEAKAAEIKTAEAPEAQQKETTEAASSPVAALVETKLPDAPKSGENETAIEAASTEKTSNEVAAADSWATFASEKLDQQKLDQEKLDQEKLGEEKPDRKNKDEDEARIETAKEEFGAGIAANLPAIASFATAADLAPISENVMAALSEALRSPEPEPIPVAVASSHAHAVSRWTAVAVALAPEEATISLEDEMRRAQASASLAAVSSGRSPAPFLVETQPFDTQAINKQEGTTAAAPADVSTVAPAPEPISTSPAVAAVAEPEIASVASANVEPVSVETTSVEATRTDLTRTSDDAGVAAESTRPVVKEFETVAPREPEPSPARAEVPLEPSSVAEPISRAVAEVPTPVSTTGEISAAATKPSHSVSMSASAESAVEPVSSPGIESATVSADEPAVPFEPAAEAVASAPEAISTEKPEPEITKADAPSLITGAEASETYISQESASQQGVESAEIKATEETSGGLADMAKKESEIASTTAAAWASWRRIRQTDNKSATPDKESAAENASDDAASPRGEAAMAVAAGAEKAPEDVAPDSETPEIASIVDSVLADLRPKIVEEISKKLGKKKK